MYGHQMPTVFLSGGLNEPLLVHDVEKCKRFSDNIMLYFFVSSANSDFRSIRPKIIRL
jgi:hypothetical protein